MRALLTHIDDVLGVATRSTHYDERRGESVCPCACHPSLRALTHVLSGVLRDLCARVSVAMRETQGAGAWLVMCLSCVLCDVLHAVLSCETSSRAPCVIADLDVIDTDDTSPPPAVSRVLQRNAALFAHCADAMSVPRTLAFSVDDATSEIVRALRELCARWHATPTPVAVASRDTGAAGVAATIDDGATDPVATNTVDASQQHAADVSLLPAYNSAVERVMLAVQARVRLARECVCVLCRVVLCALYHVFEWCAHVTYALTVHESRESDDAHAHWRAERAQRRVQREA
jgi:hypothetical protein